MSPYTLKDIILQSGTVLAWKEDVAFAMHSPCKNA